MNADERCAVNPLVSLDEFCEQQHPRLVRTVATHCGDRDQAEEIAQDALARACDHWDELRHMDAPGAWLHRVARNLTASHYRRQRTRRRTYERLAEPDAWHTDPDTPTVVAVRRALELLPARQRAAVTLRYLDDWAVADVADVLDTTEDAVKSLTYRGINTLRDQLAPEDPPSRLRRAAGLLAIVLVATTLAAVASLSHTGPEPVYIDPGPPPTLPVETDSWWANSTATITGATTDILRLTDLVTARADDPMDGEPLDTVDLTLRAPGEGAVAIRGEIERISTTGDDLEVLLVHDGVFYRSLTDECTVTLNHIGPRPDATLGSYLITGSITCRSLAPQDGGTPVALHVTIHHELGAHPPDGN